MKTVTLGYPLIQLQSVNSTNSYASQLLRQQKITEGTVILAVHQTGGRGQGNNQWVSDEGLNLLFSIILKPDFLDAHKQFYLSMAVAVGIHDYISRMGIPALIKWPNDILIHSRKIAGILIENTIMSKKLHTSVIGIGLNVNQRTFPPQISDPTSLILETGKPFDLADSLKELLSCLEVPINEVYQSDFGRIKSSYLNKLWLMNNPARFTDQNSAFEGRIVDIAETGELVVMKTNGETAIYGFREVDFKKR